MRVIALIDDPGVVRRGRTVLPNNVCN